MKPRMKSAAYLVPREGGMTQKKKQQMSGFMFVVYVWTFFLVVGGGIMLIGKI
jgi:hypothetical protein